MVKQSKLNFRLRCGLGEPINLLFFCFIQRLDFNSEKGGFSYSLTNVVHPHQPGATSSASLSQGTAALSSQSSSSAPIATNTLNKVQSAGFIPSAYYNVSYHLK